MLGLMRTYFNMEMGKTRIQIQDLDTTQVALKAANHWEARAQILGKMPVHGAEQPAAQK